MKKTILTLVIAVVSTVSFAQDFNVSKIDTVDKTKDELYSMSKLFIAKMWNSANDVIQSDDKDAGIILLKGKSIQKKYYQMNDHTWVYSYTITIQVKSGKCRIEVSDVNCDRAGAGGYSWPLIPISEPSVYPGFKKCAVNEERYFEITNGVKDEMRLIVSKYSESIKSADASAGF
jgi:hypothetical protein